MNNNSVASSIQDALWSLRYHGIGNHWLAPMLQRLGIHQTGYVRLRLRTRGEDRWHFGCENAHGLWSLSIHAGVTVLELIGPFRLVRIRAMYAA